MSAESGAQAVREVERKFRVHGLYRMPDLATGGAVAQVVEFPTITLVATYYDTDDLRLAREGITLRRRTGGDDEGWHLKIPAAPSSKSTKADVDSVARTEIQLPLEDLDADSEAAEPPAELRNLVLAIVRTDTLRPVATLRTERYPRELSALVNGEPMPLVTLTDDVVSVVDTDGTIAARFRELELEDLEGQDLGEPESDASGQAPGEPADPAALQEARAELVSVVSEALVRAGAAGGEFVAKAVRALGPFAAAPPEIPAPADVSPADPASEAIAAHLARHSRALRRADIMVRRDEPDSVHQMRVAARRLRSGLKVFSPLVDTEWADALRAELSWVAGNLGDYRDAEVLLSRLECHLDLLEDDLDTSAALALIRGELNATMSRARADALQMLDSKRYLDLHAQLVDAAASPVTTADADRPGRDVLPPLATKAWKKLAKECDRLLRDELSGNGAPDEEWHETRILAKKARYAVEVLAPVFGSEANRFAKKLAEVTEVLGEHQDAAIAKDRVEEIGTLPDAPSPAAFVMGVLRGVEQESADRQRGVFAGVWPRVSKARWRSWLVQ